MEFTIEYVRWIAEELISRVGNRPVTAGYRAAYCAALEELEKELVRTYQSSDT